MPSAWRPTPGNLLHGVGTDLHRQMATGALDPGETPDDGRLSDAAASVYGLVVAGPSWERPPDHRRGPHPAGQHGALDKSSTAARTWSGDHASIPRRPVAWARGHFSRW